MNTSLPNSPLFLLLFFALMLSLFGQSATNKKDDYKLTVSVDLVGVLATVTTTGGEMGSHLII